MWNDYVRCREISGCDDVALGRGAIANPQLAKQIRENVAPIPWRAVKISNSFLNLSLCRYELEG